MKRSLVLFFFTLISLINAKDGKYWVHSHSGSWCDYETKLGKVNIQVKLESNIYYDRNLNFTMTLIDKNKKEYSAKCYIGENEQTSDKSFISYCLFSPTNYDTNLYYKNNSLVITNGSDNVVMENDFYVIAQKCSSSEGYGEKDYNNIKLTFRQINKFRFSLIDSQITFKLFVITTESIEKGNTINLFIYLVLKDGTIETKLSKALCTLDETVKPKNGNIQADFSCKIDGLKNQYVTFILNNSDDVVGIPKEETLLNPIKTADAIEKGNLTDFSKKENKDKFLPLFIPKSINGTNCSEEGEFKIIGILNDTIENLNTTEFILPISYPYNYSSKCYLEKTEKGDGEINCIIGKELIGESLIFEQQIIKDGSKELFILESIKSEQMNCTAGNISFDDEWLDNNETNDIIEAEEKSNLSLSFRQLNLFNNTGNLIKFYFFGLTTRPLTKGQIIYLFVNLILDDEIIDPNLTKAICKLDKSVNSTTNEQVQADFSCNITLNETLNYTSFVLNHTNNVVGIPKDETLLNPVKTYEAIEKENLTDYSKEENKNKSVPLFIPELIDGSSCSEEGEFKIIGSLNTDIEQDIEFTLPMTYPQNYSSNCTIVKIAPGKGEMHCVVEKEFFGKPLIIEQQTIRDGLKELFTLKRIKSNNYLYCGYLDIKVKEDKEKAENRTKIPITFRQIKDFKSYPGGVTFMIFALITEKIKPIENITIFVNLIRGDREKEDETTEVICTLSKKISSEIGKPVQGEFICNKTGLEEEYYSLRLNSSETITGIPTDEVLLDPVLTEIAIEKKIIIDFSKNENKEIIPPMLMFTKIDEGNCRTNGTLIIEGNVTEIVKKDTEFNIPLLYPEGVSLKCHFDKEEAGANKIICQTDNDIDNKQIMTEQIIIKEGKEEFLNLEGFSSGKKITCTNGLLIEKVKKKDINIAFRQVSHLKPNGKNGFSFIFVSLISNKDPVEYIKMKIIVLIDDHKIEKEANCTILNDVDPKDGKQVQRNFQCEVIVESEEYPKIDFANVESIKISPENDQISGISNLDNSQTSPLATDKAINETDANSTDLSECIDYFKVKNINPPSLEIAYIDDDFKEKGKLRVVGKFSDDIKEKMVFELPLTFPSTKLKCKVIEAKANEEVEIICKVQKEFNLVKTFIFEPRLIKKRNKEMVFIKSNSFNFSHPISCDNYNNIKYERAKTRQKLHILFLYLSKLIQNGKFVKFNMALTRKNGNTFKDPFPLKTKVIKIKPRLNNLRILEDTSLSNEELSITCTLNGEKSITAVGYNCLSDKEASNTPSNIRLITDDIDFIAGIPDDIDPSELNYAIDYSIADNLQIIDNLPNVTITSIEGSDCAKNGEYVIRGTFEGNLKNYSNVEIPFGFPDSSGLCDIKVKNRNVTMNCHNKEQFDYNIILVDAVIVQDSEGKGIFRLDNYTDSETLFACDFSVYSVPKVNNSSSTDTETLTSDTINLDDTNFLGRKTSSSGLSGGSIAAFVISSAVLLIAVIAIILIGKLDLFSKNQSIPNKTIFSIGSNTSIAQSVKL